jgi:hypothetical protein
MNYFLSCLIYSIIILQFTIQNTNADENPGEDAVFCLSISEGSEDSNGGKSQVFTNNCEMKIFIIYCGNSLYGNGECGNGPNQGFFVFSQNLDPGMSYESVAIKTGGEIHYGACIGGISFGNDGEFKDYPDGSYECLDKTNNADETTTNTDSESIEASDAEIDTEYNTDYDNETENNL